MYVHTLTCGYSDVHVYNLEWTHSCTHACTQTHTTNTHTHTHHAHIRAFTCSTLIYYITNQYAVQ